MRKIIREELEKLIEIEPLRSMSNSHPVFSNPERAFDYAMEWAEKANQLKHFHQLVGNILWDTSPPEERIEQLRHLYKEYAIR